jgi:hypothetical protein
MSIRIKQSLSGKSSMNWKTLGPSQKMSIGRGAGKDSGDKDKAVLRE